MLSVFESFVIDVAADFKQYWEQQVRFSVQGESLIVMFHHGHIHRTRARYICKLTGRPAWRVALEFAASMSVNYRIPPQALRNHLRFRVEGWNDWRTHLVALALLRQDLQDRPRSAAFIDQSMYGKAFLTLTEKQGRLLWKEFGNLIKSSHDRGGFPSFLEKWRTLDALEGFDRDDLGGFLSRFGYGKENRTTAEVLGMAGVENEEALRLRPPQEEPAKRGGRMINMGYSLAEELGLAGVSLIRIG